MNTIIKILFALTLTVSLCFAATGKQMATAAVQMMVRYALSDSGLDVEVTFDEKSLQLLNQVAPPLVFSEPDPHPVNYQSDFKLQLRVSDGTLFPLNGSYKCFKYFQVATKKIVPGALIEKGQLKTIKLECSKRQDVVTNKDNVIGMEVLEEIQPGVPISLSFFIPPIIIPTGSIVDVLVYGRKVPHKNACITLAPGRLGDVVPCRSLKTHKLCCGTVLHSKKLFMPSSEGLFEPPAPKGSSVRYSIK